MSSGRRPFVAAYRFQLTPDADFDVAASLVPYFATLGVSHLYVSPIAEAEIGSRHGYDITDPTKVRAELGGADALDRLCVELDRLDLGLIIDIVPNHLSIATPERNPWFWDVLRHGTASIHADAFDIDWEGGDGKVLLPVLTQPLSNEIATITGATGASGAVIVLSTGMRLPVDEPIEGMAPDAVATVLARQPYRLVPWQSTERNQRRFFEIDSLAGVAVEDEAVRRDRHALLSQLLERWPNIIDGVRVDHVDGLAHPDDYFVWLRQLIGNDRLLIIEKILVGDETLPERWPVDGTTGYEFALLVDRLLTNDDDLAAMRSIWVEATGDRDSYDAVEHTAIEEVLADRLRPEVERIHRLIEDDDELAGDRGVQAITALVVSTGRYRTYLPSGGEPDATLVIEAAERAQRAQPLAAGAIARLAAIISSPTTESQHHAQTLFQQLTGPALAKGGEDRALYRHLPVAALNEVGGNPGCDEATPADFHHWAARTASNHPRALLTTSTHDTKRSGDVRARLLALAQQPEIWRSLVDAWRTPLDLHPADTLLLLQSVIGTWPITEQRLADYLIKALREAALRSSWIDPDTDYESKVTASVAASLADESFVTDIERVVASIKARAATNSLTQTLLRLTAPGIGDLYRGSEVADLSLVDPDNRRRLDWEPLHDLSAASDELDVASALRISLDLAKMTLIKRTLTSRRATTTASASASATNYEPIVSSDPSVLAYRNADMLVVVALGTPPVDPSATIVLPAGTWHNVLRSAQPLLAGVVELGHIIDDDLPMALLEKGQ